MRVGRLAAWSALAAGVLASLAGAQAFNPALYGEMRWRMIGPLRGGRTRAVEGVPSQPNVFYIAQVNGGVWKTTDYGRTWTPIFDGQPTGSVGAIAVAPSDPNVIYVGSGEGLQRPDLSVGDGIYKSTDGGATWQHLGLRDGQQIPRIVVDPRNPNRLFVAVLGHPYGPNAERGIFRSTDGGQSFQKVLFKDENTGGSDVELDPSDPNIVYASLWESRQGPWENSQWSGTGGGLFKSTDGGNTWRPLTQGLPPGVVQVNLAVAPSRPQRLYASVAYAHATGIYRSDDGGETWTQATTDPRPAARIGGGDLAVLRADPKNPDVVYSASTVAWKSVDAGQTWTGIRGAPGGDDYQNIWINPNNPDIILLGSDQGAIITVNGGQSWSSWYNQPTAQMYHVTADNAFPYRLCGGQQESGSACVSSRGNWGQITVRDWLPVGAEEYGYVAPDPLDPDIVYGGKLTRFDRRTGQTQEILPQPLRGDGFRVVRTEPVIFSPVDPHTLYFAANTLWKTQDGGQSWQPISPDLTRKTWEVPPSVGKYRDQPSAQPTQRGVIYAVAPSPKDANLIWIGTDDGLIQVTRDGGTTWTDVTPPELTPWSKVSQIEASHFDAAVAYASVNRFRLDDLRAYIYRTRDGGRTWQKITQGLPDNAPVNAVREDPLRRGLLFAATETSVWVSFDDGDHWQSLQLNLPHTSMRDLTIHGDDLAVATHGRGFWILDDLTPLRQITPAVAESEAYLFRPALAYRVRWDTNTDTPLPPDEPAGKNPPDGAILDYYLKSEATSPVTLEILDGAGKLVRRFSSADQPEPIDPRQVRVPLYWLRLPQTLSAKPGMHRFVWDLHYPPPDSLSHDYPIAAVYHDTPRYPLGPWVLPGQYAVRLTVNGQSQTQPLTIRMDPRVHTPQAGLEQQFRLATEVCAAMHRDYQAVQEVKSLRAQLLRLRQRASANLAAELSALDQKAEALAGSGGGFELFFGGTGGPPNLSRLNTQLNQLLQVLEGADATPTRQAVAAVAETEKVLESQLAAWQEMKTRDLPALNAQLAAAGLPEVKLEPESGEE
jgi:photosystem II stability/assembly factor-like uncharacterized protein